MSDAVLVFDDDCGFCTWWAAFFEAHTDVRVVGFTDLDAALRERLPGEYETCSHLVTPESVYSCGESVEQAALLTPAGPLLRPLVAALRRSEGYHRLREWGYRRVADSRAIWGRVLSKTPPARRAGDEE